jgi:hypothetical protein
MTAAMASRTAKVCLEKRNPFSEKILLKRTDRARQKGRSLATALI